ncbi:MAG: CRISPR-associated ring nuclease Csm6 [Victivallaceae bacterium]|nr:CRISPR-associated ring nuclease Csm6 [Victivallaceae bacterium]MDD4317592.1 CRISPR-associated ring nuclease Csm6 [Victivallaceae bacterium]
MKQKHILLALCGMSPAVITETVYKLAKCGDPPHKVVVITTSAGEAALKQALFTSGVWKQLLETIEHDIAFAPNQDHIRLLPDSEGNASDILTSRATDRASNFILDVLRQYTENSDVRITFSIAGGRKTMSAIGALCMSLLGRDYDKLCHILVNPPFDDPSLIPKFYFPASGQTHKTRDGQILESSQAELELSEIPFVRCRYLIEQELKRLPGDYSAMVKYANRNARQLHDTPELILTPATLECQIGSALSFKLPQKEFVLYSMLAHRCRHDKPDIDGTANLHRYYQRFAEKIKSSLPTKFPNLEIENSDSMRKLISNISARVKDFPALKPTRAKGKYGIGTDKSKISIMTSDGRPESCP